MSDNRETFAYGGEEVDLSVWSAELAWRSQPESSTVPKSSKKRKRGDDLFPAEIWRARNVRDYFKIHSIHGILLTHGNRFPTIT